MGKIYACVGRYAATPYTIKKVWIRVYSAEELAFYICNNAFLLEEEFFTPELLMWLEEECDLPLTAKRIRTQKRQNDRLEALVRIFLEDIHYVTVQEMDELDKLLQANRSMSGVEKSKIQADYFLNNNRLALAQEAYEALQDKLDSEKDREMLACVYHNLGVVYAKLFHFERAADYFMDAYRLNEKDSHMVGYLTAKRMVLPEREFLAHISKIPGAYGCSEILEKRLEEANAEWKSSEEYMKITGMEKIKEEGGIADYYQSMEFQLSVFKEEYRTMMAR